MTSVQTDPDYQEAIISQLSKWRSGSVDVGMVPPLNYNQLWTNRMISVGIILLKDGCHLNGNDSNKLTII
jgi:hypothetical protein